MSLRLPAAERREQLLTTSLLVFARDGYHGTSMNDVADAAGVTKPVLYQHFDSKHDLYLALLEDNGDKLADIIAKATSEADGPHDQVRHGFEAYFRWVSHEPAAFQLLFGGGGRRNDEFAEAIRRVEDRIASAIAPLIRADIDTDHQHTLAYGIIGLAETVARRLIANGSPFDPDVVSTQVADLVWAGLRTVHRVH